MRLKTEQLWRLAEPHLNTRANDIHARLSVEFAYALLRSEGGDEDIVIPAMILHDVGWKRVPEHLQLSAFGPKADAPEINRIHEREGASMAASILEKLGYEAEKIREIAAIVEGHDSRKVAISHNDKIVKDADKLWRFSKIGFEIDVRRFEQTEEEEIERLRSNLEEWFFTDSAKEIARKELDERVKERRSKQ